MAVDARSRRSLYDLLKEPLGMDATNALLDELPPLGADLATKDDIEDVKADIDRLRTATKGDIEGVRADVDRLRMETTGHIARLDQRIEERATLTEERLGRQLAEVKASLSAQNVRMMLGMLGLIVALVISLVMLR